MVLKEPSLQQIWMYYKEKITKKIADLNTFMTIMSLRDQVKASIKTLIPCLFTYVHTALKWLRGAKILQQILVEIPQLYFCKT